jgi:hypothetical protein
VPPLLSIDSGLSRRYTFPMSKKIESEKIKALQKELVSIM